MAWGFWNKVKDGFTKVGQGLLKGLSWLGNVFTKHGDKLAKGISTITSMAVPGATKLVAPVVGLVSDGLNAITGRDMGAMLDTTNRGLELYRQNKKKK